ncbi:MAG: preprotein translocase subunit SecE [Pseudomonadota bacterium]|nr:preprotein translocase subunit SecE [Pseudomonadota bacterium]
MNAKTETPAGWMDVLKWVLAVAVVVAGVVAFYYFADQLFIYRVLMVVAATAVGLAIASQTDLGRSVLGLAHESTRETRKVVWPGRQETVQTSLAVTMMVLIVGVFLWVTDLLLSVGLRLLTGIGS